MSIEEYIAAHQLSRARFASLVGCTRQTVINWLKGRRIDPRFWARLDALGIQGYPRAVVCAVRIVDGNVTVSL